MHACMPISSLHVHEERVGALHQALPLVLLLFILLGRVEQIDIRLQHLRAVQTCTATQEREPLLLCAMSSSNPAHDQSQSPCLRPRADLAAARVC